MKRWIFILAITFSVVQISDGIFGKSKSWNVPAGPRDPFDTPRWCYRQKPLGESEDYDDLTTTPNPFLDNGWKRPSSRFPKLELSCFGCGGSSSSENDVEHGGRRCKPKKHKSKKPKKPKDKHKKHKKHHGNKNDDLWAPRPPVGYEGPNINDVFD